MRARPLANHDVQHVVLHHGIEDFLHGGAARRWNSSTNRTSWGSQLGEHLREVRPRGVNDGPAVTRTLTPISAAMINASVVLPSPGRAVQEDVIQRLIALQGGLDGDLEVVNDATLANVVRKRGEDASRSQARCPRSAVPARLTDPL